MTTDIVLKCAGLFARPARAVAAVLVAASFAVTPAAAAVIRDEAGNLVTLPPSKLEQAEWRKRAEEMASDCNALPLTDPSATRYTKRELAGAALELLMIAVEVRDTGIPNDPAYGSAEAEFKALVAAANALEVCHFNNNALDRAVRAIDSCAALLDGVEKVDAAAGALHRRGALFPGDRVKALEMFLLGAQRCRNTLGKCYNPDNKSQSAAALALMRLEIALKFSSGDAARLELHLPACTKTMLRAGLDTPGNTRVAIEYVNSMIGNEFSSTGGELR